jgi:amino acid adenylation domain-containing protein/non-ribosomal peptide synthase protein (TIGR01720 family)
MIDFLSIEDKKQLLIDFNATDRDYPKNKTIVDLFEEQVEKNPSHIAIYYNEKSITYNELNMKSNQLARYIASQFDIYENFVIGVCLPKSEDSIIALLAILKLGAIYLPLDVNYPEERINYLISDSSLDLIISNNSVINNINCPILSIETINSQHFVEDNLNIEVSSSDLAYIIYTSGSTGLPKGVGIRHTSTVNMSLDQIRLMELNVHDKVVWFSSVSFDASISEIMMCFFCGGTLCIPNEDVIKDKYRFSAFLKKAEITIATFPPSYLEVLTLEDISGLKCIITAGESPNKSKALEIIKQGIKYYNAYGPTECTVCVTMHKVTLDDFTKITIPIGGPIANTQLFILQDNLSLAAVGVVGKLYVSGVCLAEKYLNRPELTQEKFVINPFLTNTLMYDTGDLCRWLPDGSIEFIGRYDDQIKIRGFRVEPKEIESTIYSYSNAIKSVFVVKVDYDLVAYYTVEEGIEKSELDLFLKKKLPDYMIPTFYVELSEFPLLVNGKIDRNSLPDVGGNDLIKNEYKAPESTEEIILVSVLESVLKRTKISVKDSFYNLGGDSIKSIQIVSRLRQKGYLLKIQQVLQIPIVEELAKNMILKSYEKESQLVSGEVLLTPIQRYFFETKTIKTHSHYNQSLILKSKEKLDTEILAQSISFLVRHHDGLRMIYKNDDRGNWTQFYENVSDTIKIQFYDLQKEYDSIEMMGTITEKLQSSFNLEKGPLIKVNHFRLNDGDRLVIVIHHLVVDGVSWRIILEDLSNAYYYYSIGEVMPSPIKTDSFQRWAALLKEYALTENLRYEKEYWERISNEFIPFFPENLRIDNVNEIKLNDNIVFTLDKSATYLLQSNIHDVYKTNVTDILLTGLGIAIQKTFSIQKMVIRMEGHGREEIIPGVDISRTVGWFTAVYPFILSLTQESSLFYNLIEVKEAIRKIPNKGIGYGIQHYLGNGFQQALKPSMEFNYLGEFNDNQINQMQSIFDYSSEYIGSNVSEDNESDVPISVSGILVSNQLSISISFSDKIYEKEKIQILSDCYKESLLGIIEKLSVEMQGHLTPSDLTFKELNINQLLQLDSVHSIEDIYKLSPLQQGIYYLWLSKQSNSMYFEQMSYRIRAKNLNIMAIKDSYDKLVARHDVLRTSFVSDLFDFPLQIVYKTVKSNFEYKRLPSKMNSFEFIEKEKLDDKEKGFNLETPCQMRLLVLDMGNDEFEFIWSHHHIIIDGWCMSILLNDFYQILNSSIQGVKEDLNKPLPYSEYIKWLDKVDINKSLSFWKNYLKDYDTAIKIPFEKSQKEKVYLGETEIINIDGELYSKINELINHLGITQNSFLQVIWGYLLSLYNNTNDVVFGAVVSGRPADLTGVEEMVGLFVNAIPIRIRYDEDITVKELLQKVHEDMIFSNDYHYINLSDVQSQCKLGMELINHIMIFENYPIQEIINNKISGQDGNSELVIENIEVFEQTNYDFNIMVSPELSSLKIYIKFNKNHYDAKLMKNVSNHLYNLIEQCVNRVNDPITSLSYLSIKEKNQILSTFNETNYFYPEGSTILDWFENQVNKIPNNVAVVFKDEELTYKELNEKANQFGAYLREKYSVIPDDFIGVKLERSLNMMITILGILKAGGAYVPIDINLPEERISYIEQDSKCKVVIDEIELVEYELVREGFSTSNLVRIHQSSNLVYMIYTSGSTGNPKGVMVEHKALINRLEWMQRAHSLSEYDVILQKTDYSFDVSVWELFWWMYKGAKLCLLCHEGQKNPEEILSQIELNRITIIHFVPAMLSLFLDYLKENEISNSRLVSLRKVFVSGEVLQISQNNKFFDQFENVSLINLYGPTEATIDVSSFECSKDLAIIPIGKPIDNIRFYILDTKMNLVGIGITGTLYISGVGLARGYINQPSLTKSKFLTNPFNKKERIYNTGDLARWLPDGNVEFLGRHDNQVKIRGYRIELGEIENTIIQFSNDIKQVLVDTYLVDEDLTLIVYFESEKEIDKLKLKVFLKEKLPDYMIPHHFVEVDRFPLMSNGKINRKDLPRIIKTDLISERYVAPRNEIEDKLTQNIALILGYEQDKIGVYDNFFDLGMNSLKLIRLLNIIKKEQNLSIGIPMFFEFPNINDLSNQIYNLKNMINEDTRDINGDISEELDDLINHFSE